MADSSSAKIILISLALSVAIVAAGLYFGVPLLYPDLFKEDPDTRIVVQVKSLELKSNCILWDYETEQKMMNETSMLITTRGNTSLSVEFSTNLLYGISASFQTGSSFDFVSYNITISIAGVQNYSSAIEFGELSNGLWGSLPFSMHIITPSLAAGTYNITMYWNSRTNANGDNWLSANHPPGYSYNSRLLYVEELKLN